MTIKRIRIKIEIQNKSYFLLKDKIKKKNHLKKSPNKIIKRMRVKMKKKIYGKLRLKNKIENK